MTATIIGSVLLVGLVAFVLGCALWAFTESKGRRSAPGAGDEAPSQEEET